MHCPNCGIYNPDGAAFCASCGTPLPAIAGYSAPQPYYAPPAPAIPGKAQGLTGMICGIVSAALFCIWYLALPAGIVGIVFSVLARNKARAAGINNTAANAGLACSCVGVGLSVLFLILVFTAFAEAFYGMGRYY